MSMHFLIIGGYCEITATFLQEKVPIFTRKWVTGRVSTSSVVGNRTVFLFSKVG